MLGRFFPPLARRASPFNRNLQRLSSRRYHATIIGEPMVQHIDVSRCNIGDTIDVPYEITVTEGWITLWQSCFYQHDRLYTSEPFAKELGFKGTPLPFSLMLFKTVSMSHVDSNKEVLDLGFDNAIYRVPAYPGQTFRKQYIIKGLRTSDGKGTVATIRCELYNMDQELVFDVDKQMLFYGQVNEDNKTSESSRSTPGPPSRFLRFLQERAESDSLPAQSYLAPIEVEQLILANYSKCLGRSMTASLTTLSRMTHPMLYDTYRFKESEIVVSGGLVLALTTAAASIKLYEMLYEELDHCVFPNRLSHAETVSAMTYISDRRTLNQGLEEVFVTNLGVKNIALLKELRNIALPLDLFQKKLRPAELEALVEKQAPQLKGKIVCQSFRRLVRQSPYAHRLNVPLL